MFGPPRRGGCGPHGPDGPIPVQVQPAAERTGLLSSSARLQPSAKGRLRAADRSAIEFTDDHSAKIDGCGLLRLLIEAAKMKN